MSTTDGSPPQENNPPDDGDVQPQVEVKKKKKKKASSNEPYTKDYDSDVEYESFDEDESIKNPAGRINLSFPEHPEYEEQCYPPSYYTLSSKERLLLLYAENFRKQYFVHYRNTRPLVLAIKNECEVEKFVCQTIRPTSFVFPTLSTWQEISSFVADFVVYQPLKNPIALYKIPKPNLNLCVIRNKRKAEISL